MKRILIAFDGTPGAVLAVKDLDRAGLGDSVEAHVLAIADVWLPPAESENAAHRDTPLDERMARAHQNASEALDEAKKFSISGAQLVHQLFPRWTVTNSAIAGSPAWGLLAEAKNWRADMIVVGSHGRTPLERFFIGSVSYKVVAEAVCSVRIVKPHPRLTEHPRILVGVDGSEDSQRALDEVLARRWWPGTEIDVITIVDQKLRSTVLAQQPGDRVEDWINPLFKTLETKFHEKGLTTRFHSLEGDAKKVLLSVAAERKADLIFLGARGLNHGNRLYLGTLASAVCSRAHCTVEIIRSSPQ